MPQFQHDGFAKSYLTELLNTIGKAVPNRRIKSEEREADLWFELNPAAGEQRRELGLLGMLLTRDALIEVFRNPATAREIRACQGKLFDLEAEFIRRSKQRQQTIEESRLPYLWLIMPSASQALRSGFGMVAATRMDSAEVLPGVYEFPRLDRTGLIVVHQLPKTEETLWLRILGRAGNQRQAIAEFTRRSNDNDLYATIEELIADYRTKLENLGRQLTEEDEELIMNLSEAYLKRRQEWRQEGIQENQQSTAVAALREGFSVEVIMRLTGLSRERIEQLREGLESQGGGV
ncbi:hypothetical protein IQ266_27475 [filamentous cyanobacterium LEGE 11480]|uniref:PD-(D/E)XK nuclease family transposase n=1 Tax=Romeriopsis navalis LEGE 11480 TaxID=2777977 RepID=A0A928VUT6_9CYAN|nr:hypothetical protein [Romeriopsis navalis]MBE9033476.1 hypothetical protein [Romeriopsis navalis LEGE 11480]